MYSLFLYDSNHHLDIYSDVKLTQHLINLKFIQEENGLLIPADLFMQLLLFLGCSPNIEHEINSQITTKVTSVIQAIGGDSITQLVCPNCKTQIDKASTLLKNYTIDKKWHSPCCKNNILLKDINWRKSAGFSQSFIQISHVFPKEAMPTDEFLNKLSQFSQSPWNYFYSKQQLF